ncbi:T9SS type A sorting domain-containing protein [Bacteroidia bacterium]|nr:T9SS type A sorting domain-containing protein [Bacteroidia bacterium]MDB9881686.1 T9SS type A sorting domain-containing protein [Bacteroidia bacterium]
MRFFIILIAFAWNITSIRAQVGYSTMGTEHTLRVNANGSLGMDLSNNTPASFYNGDINLPFLKQAGLWIVAEDNNGQFHTATHYASGIDSFDFWAGPVDTLTGQTGQSADWDNAWKVTQEEIINHKENYQKTGYNVPKSIATWPANGSDGFAKYLAPFVDINNNKIYDPASGDYPEIKGIEATYCIFNDIAEEHNASFGQELGIEIQMMAYRLTNSSQVYLEYYLINRRPSIFKSVKVGFFIDGECGSRTDNYAGTLEQFPQTIFVYNSDDTDENHFEKDLPYVIATFLNETLSSTISFDDKHSINGKPTINQHFINYSNSLWKDSSMLSIGEDGTTKAEKTSFIFSQSIKNSKSFWTEEDRPNVAGGRTILGFVEASSLNPKDYLKLDICLDAGTYVPNEVLREKIISQSTKNFIQFRKTSNVFKTRIDNQITLYPNPSTGTFKIKSNLQVQNFIVYDYQGIKHIDKEIFSNTEFSCNILLNPGVYYLQLITKEGMQTKKLCIRP